MEVHQRPGGGEAARRAGGGLGAARPGLGERAVGLPGRHKIVCKVQYRPVQGSPPAPEMLEYVQEVRTEKEVLDNAFADARPPTT